MYVFSVFVSWMYSKTVIGCLEWMNGDMLLERFMKQLKNKEHIYIVKFIWPITKDFKFLYFDWK